MVNLGCEVDYTFKNGFILGDEHLHTITSKIKERFPNEELVYRITRNDSYVYLSSDVDDIINEENGSSNYIKKLEFILNVSETLHFNLCFEKNEDTSLRITGSDRDKIYLLYNDIKTYVEKDITTVKLFINNDLISKFYGAPLIPLLGVFACFIYSFSKENAYANAALIALESNDLGIKLNYLIEDRIRNLKFFGGEGRGVITLMGISLLMMVLPILNSIFLKKGSAFRITDYFLFGKQKEVYNKKLKLKNQIIWTVVVGLFISIIAGFIVYFMTN